jgi:CAAX prenyl protease-like protein
MHELFFGAMEHRSVEIENRRFPVDDGAVGYGETNADLPGDPNPYASPQSAVAFGQADEEIPFEEPRALHGAAAALSIAISSVVFALLHYTHGPDWIPLILLAAGMGYLYQRTHRLLPSLTVHACLNGLSMCGLWVQVHGEGFSS